MMDEFETVALNAFDDTTVYAPLRTAQNGQPVFLHVSVIANALSGMYRLANEEQRKTIDAVAAGLGCIKLL